MGYVGHGNLYGDAVAKANLREWWGGEAPTPENWQFNLKASDNDKVGHSFAILVANDHCRQHILERLAADAKAQRPTRVFFSGQALPVRRADAVPHADGPSNLCRLI